MCGNRSDGCCLFEFTNTLKKFGKERFDLLFPDFFDIVDPVIPKETNWDFIDVAMTETPESEHVKDSITVTEIMEKPNPRNGSTNIIYIRKILMCLL